MYKNDRLHELWNYLDHKLVQKQLDNGKICFDTSKVTDDEVLYFLNEASRALKVDTDSLKQMTNRLNYIDGSK